MNKVNETTIHIIDDDYDTRKSLRWLCESVKFHVETYESATRFLSVYQQTFQGCILLDIRMPGISGMELFEKLNSLNNTLPIIIITGYADVPMAVKAMKMGAVDFILKPINDQNLLEVINKCFNQSNVTTPSASVESVGLTAREHEIMNLIAEGKYNKQIAYELNISISTVEAHRSKIMQKFQAKNLVHLIKLYYQIS